MEISELTLEAERCLREADPLCSDANAYYAELRLLVEQSTVLWARILFIHTAQQNQLQNMGNVCLVVKSAVERSQQECQQRIKLLRKSQVGLRELIGQLKNTSVDILPVSGLSNPLTDSASLPNSNPSSLFQFVHEEDVAALDSRVNELCDQLQRMLSELEKIPYEVQQELGKLRASGPEVQENTMEIDLPRKMARMTARSAPFARQMAELLTSLTSHYDLCSQIPQLSAEDAKQALEVVRGDRDQVLLAINQLKDARSQLKTRHKQSQRMQNSLDLMFEQCLSYGQDLAHFVAETLQPVLNQIQNTHAECRSWFGDFDAVDNELNSLTEYYKLFMKSYHALVEEISRRHESAKQLNKIIENANNALKGFHDREMGMRESFKSTYCEFLPPDLWEGMNDAPREYTVAYIPEPLPQLRAKHGRKSKK